MLSSDIKTALLYYCRFKRQWAYVATEVGQYNADVLAANFKELIEFEVKCSVSDLKKDFEAKIEKHHKYAKAEDETDWKVNVGCYPERPFYITDKFANREKCLPNKLYYVVPTKILKASQEILRAKEPYGIIEYNDTYKAVSMKLTSVKRAKPLHARPPSLVTLRVLAARMSSELAQARLGKYDDYLKQLDAKPKLTEDPDPGEEL